MSDIIEGDGRESKWGGAETKLSDIPTEQFPLNFRKYCQLVADIRTAAYGFDDLGTASGRAVSRALTDVHFRLGRVWELIREIEHRETAN
ncbi:hypothetical protein [Rhizobium leguminosarum]|uniref:hypothetical protein n=1 Tax=Rhizobium TaxID=379 RepID=UPI0010404C4C|nr:hypothetical protein [Rhizobium leguminosarum]TCA72256.1 hypothetical protein E0H69_18570 [Rhizobium leguminosarum bv. viciae]